ncbi:ABC transporter substrate-binding protein [Kribbella sancticallisti]|uniref:ABC transporter substrate-binding protein n=1 Tax=Kribbella sancticallisti TaxID=460087 RepID=A0ABP4PAW7_9ACTN
MKSYSTRAMALIASAGLLAVAACSAGSGTSSGSSPGADQSLSIGLVAEPASLDFTTTDGAAIPQALLGNVYNGLVKQDDSGKIGPDLAKSWTVSPDRKTYTFELVDNAKFTNGAAFTAADAVFSINRVKTAWTTSLKAAMDVVAEAKAVSPTQLQVTLTKPSNGWLFRMTTRVGAMFSQTGVDKLATEPVGTGPYKLGTWKRGDSIVLQRNDAYWGSKPFFNQVTLKYFKDPTALNNALLTGTINVVGTVQAPEALSQFTNNDKYQVIEGTTNGEVVLSFNNSRPVFKDVAVRQAIRQAIDHKALLDTCFAGRGKLIGSMVPPTDPWYEDLTSVAPFDLAKAKAALASAGVAGTALRLRLPTLPYATSCGQVVKSQLEQAGLKVTIDQLEFPAAWLTSVFKNADYDMSIIGHVEPRDLGAVFNAKYYTRYDDPTLQALLASADAGDEAAQTEDMKKAARRLSEQAAADWLFLLPNLMVADKNVTGLPANAITESFDLSRLARS